MRMCFIKKALILLIYINQSMAQPDDLNEPFEPNTPEHLYRVTIYQIAASPQDFVSKPVYLTGYVNKKSIYAIYPDKNSCLDGFVANAITFQGAKDSSKKLLEKSKHCGILSVFGQIDHAFSYGEQFYPLFFRIAHLEGLVDIYEY